MRKLIIILVFTVLGTAAFGQKLKCNVQVISTKVQGTNKQVFETLQTELFEFMNNRIWTDHVYDIEERIECNFMFNITDQSSADEFSGTLQVSFSRPVYNSNYKTVMMNFVDNDIKFNYVEFEPLEFDLNSHISNLTSILGFYAYYIIGMDYDSFSFEGGTEYYKNAEKIVENVNSSNSGESGWKASDDMSHRNRYWFIKDILDADYAALREFNYRYHRHGLDIMDEKIVEGRAEIASNMELIQKVFRKRPDPYMYLLRTVFDAKADEIINIFSEAYPEEKNRVYNILSEVDQTNTSKYKKILESNSSTATR